MIIAEAKSPQLSDEMIPFQASSSVYLPGDSERRLWEGWFTANGIDWEDESAPSTASVFQEAINEYMAKNPVVLWDHQRDMPIGKLLNVEIIEGVGIFAKGEILRSQDFGFETSEEGEAQNLEILKKCNEVWGLMKSGVVKGLSWHGRVRKQWVWSDELGEYIKEAKKVILISEVTITPVQVHPSAQITRVNTMAKALEMSKAMPLTYVKDTDMDQKLKDVQEAQRAYHAALSSLENGVDLPQEMLDVHKGLMGSIEEDSTKALGSELAELKQKVEALTKEPAPLRNRTGKEGSQAPPNGEVDFIEGVEKALSFVSAVENGVSEKGKGKPYYGTPEDTVKLIMAKSGGKIEHRNDFTISPSCQQLLKEQGL